MGPNMTVFGAAGMGAISNRGDLFELTHAGVYKVVYDFLSKGDGHCPFRVSRFSSAGSIYGERRRPRASAATRPARYSTSRRAGACGRSTCSRTVRTENGPTSRQRSTRRATSMARRVCGTANGVAGSIWTIRAATGKVSVLHVHERRHRRFGPNSPADARQQWHALRHRPSSGGKYGYGTVFSITPSGTFTVVHAFRNKGDGAQPMGNLVRGPAGAVFGGTAYGPVFDYIP